MFKHCLIVFLVSMVPIIELRGAIPIGLGMGLPVLPTYLLCVLGNMIPVPFIYLFARKFLIWGYHKPLIGPICRFCINKGEKGGRALEAKAGKGMTVALLLFVGIPLPGTGAWTGSLIAAMLEMRVREAFPPIALGVVTAGIIVAVVTYGAASLLFQLRRRLLCRASSREITAHCGTQKNPAVRWDSGIFYASLYSANAFSSASSSSRSSCGSLSPNCSKYSRMPAQFSRQLPASSVSS